MLNQAEKRREKRNIQGNRVTTILSDVNSWDYGNKKFDAVVTHFFMDSFETLEMKTIATTIKNVLKPGGSSMSQIFIFPRTLNLVDGEQDSPWASFIQFSE